MLGPNPKQMRFIDEYEIDFNATQAAIRAGYSPKTANEQGCRLLANIKISTELAKRKAERSKRLGITADRVLNELAAIAFANPDDFINLKNGMVKAKAGRADLGAIQTVKVKTTEYGDSIAVEREYKMYSKLDALEKLSKHLDLFGSTEKGERVTVIIDNIPDRRPPSSDDPAD